MCILEDSDRYMLVAIEGIDGVGKTTIATALADHLRTLGQPVRIMPMPPEELAEAANFMNHNASTKAHYLFYLAVVKHTSDQIEKQIEHGHVICARYLLSTLAYHWAANVNVRIELDDLVIVPPDLTVLLRCSENERQSRIQHRELKKPGDALKLTEDSILARIETLYHKFDDSIIEIDTTGQTPSQVAESITALLPLPNTGNRIR